MLGKVKATLEASYTDGSDTILSFRVPSSQAYMCRSLVAELKQLIKEKDCDLLLMVDKYRKKRSLDQNAFLWGLLSELAVKLRTDKESLYNISIERYGPWEYIICLDKAIQNLEKVYRVVKQIDEKFEDGKRMIKCMCYLGSSYYDSAEMSQLLNGVIQDAKDQGIDPDILWRKMGGGA